MSSYITYEDMESRSKVWLESIADHNVHEMELDMDKAALLVIDMQNFFLDPKSPSFTPGGQASVPNIKKLVEFFRSKKRPVIYTAHVHSQDGKDAGILGWWWDGMCIEGTKDAEIFPDLSPLPGERVVYKHRYSAFYNTDLETILRCQGIRDLVITGVMTNLCCESTARDAYFRDYRVKFLADATGAASEKFHMATLLNLAYGFAEICLTKDILD